MSRQKEITPINPKEILLDTILAAMEGVTFGKNLSAKIVGGEGKLLKLIGEGKIDCEKPCASNNGKWQCNAAQVLKNANSKHRTRNKRIRIWKQT